MNYLKFLEEARKLGLLDEAILDSLGPRGEYVYEQFGILAAIAYREGAKDSAAIPRLPDFKIDDDEDEVNNFYVGETLVLSTNHDDHGHAGMDAARRMFHAIAEELGLEKVDA